jgi:DNA-binding NtrC family response regulator
MATIMVVDDDVQVAGALGLLFQRLGHQVVRAGSGEEAIEVYRRVRPDLLLLDLQLGDMDGFEVLERLRDDEPVVIMFTGHGDIELAVQAMRDGAENFLTKPVDVEHLAAAAERALEKSRLRQMNRYLRDRRGNAPAAVLLGSSPAMRDLAHQIELLASSDRTHALLLGETGTGKGRVAELIHAASPRSGRPFVEVSCAGVPSAELELELFGATTGQNGGARRLAALEIADGGSLFLDEVSALDLQLQGRLLRVLEGKSVRAPDDTREIACDVRIIAATVRDLVAEVRGGRFREDLYYRLSVMPVHLPPLRARSREDMLDVIAREVDDLHRHLPDSPAELADGALDHLLRHSWPGNVRELRNVLERAMIVGRGARKLGAEHLPAEVRGTGAASTRHTPRSLAEVERSHIERTLRAHNDNRTRSARELGISRATLINKIKAYHLDEAPNGSRRHAPADAGKPRQGGGA